MYTRLVNRFLFWWYRKEIQVLISAFVGDNKYKSTGISLTADQLQQLAKKNGWSNKKLSGIIRFCVAMEIIQDMPVKGAKKKFYYNLNPVFLK